MLDPQKARKIWEAKILKWEVARYSPWAALYPASWTLRTRMARAARIIRDRMQDRGAILDLGCGSGLLAGRLNGRYGSYFGIDFAANAIEKAKRTLHPEKRADFLCADVTNLDFPSADITVFLGLTDWLNREQLDRLFRKIPSKRILFSYTDVDAVPKLNPYRAYRMLDDGEYRARSYSRNEMLKLAEAAGFKTEIVSHPSFFNPGVLIWGEKSE